MHKSIKAEYIQLAQRMVRILPPHEVSDIALNLVYSMVKIYTTVEHNRNMQTAQIFGDQDKYQIGMSASCAQLDATIKMALEEVRQYAPNLPRLSHHTPTPANLLRPAPALPGDPHQPP